MRNNRIISDVCKHIVNVFESDGTNLEYGEVLNKFEHFLMNESLVRKNSDVLNRIYGKCISNKKLMEFVVTQLYGKLNEGFYNPFSEEGDEESDPFYDDYIEIDDDSSVADQDGNQVEKVLVNDDCINGKVYYKDNKMYSGVNMSSGDVVEICPVVPMDYVSMCSRPVRDLSFLISDKEEKYGVPFGYANFYRTSQDSGLEGNVDYEYPEESPVMRIIAIKDIKPNDELVLLVMDDPNKLPANTVVPGTNNI